MVCINFFINNPSTVTWVYSLFQKLHTKLHSSSTLAKKFDNRRRKAIRQDFKAINIININKINILTMKKVFINNNDFPV